MAGTVTAHVLGLDLGLAHIGAARLFHPVAAERDELPRLLSTERRSSPTVHGRAPIEQRSRRISDAARWAASRASSSTVLVVIEAPAYAAQHGQPHERGGVWWRVVEQLVAWDLPVAVVPPKTAKRHATGNGNAEKVDVRRAMAQAHPGCGLDRVSLDESDAAALVTIGADWLGWPIRSAAIALDLWNDGRVLEGASWPDRSRV